MIFPLRIKYLIKFTLYLFTALNIQRGRDHGLPSYNDWREVCSLKKIGSWQELVGVMDDSVREY